MKINIYRLANDNYSKGVMTILILSHPPLLFKHIHIDLFPLLST